MIEDVSNALLHEAQALAELIFPLDEAQWDRPTQFKGWTITDVISHLHSGNISAINSLTQPEVYEKMRAERAAAAEKQPGGADQGNLQFQRAFIGNLRHRELFYAWMNTCHAMARAFATADAKQRVPWGGRHMSALSSISARLMEHWAHGQEIYDLLGVERRNADSLRHVALLGVNTFGWSFSNRKMAVPPGRPAVNLISPGGELWQWPATGDCADSIEGQAAEFCQVVAQTRNIADTRLQVNGETARLWMAHAQCFAGPPRTPPAPGTRGIVRSAPGGAGAPLGEPPFKGLRVLAVARVVACPFAAYQLGLHGADVIRIEDTQSGDTMRNTGGKALGLPDREMGTHYLAQAANSRSMTLNLRSEEGRRIFRELARDADVVLENLLTGAMARNGLGWEDLRRINPRLVYCSLTGFGQTGPKNRQPANDGIIQAASGLMSLTGEPDGEPVKTGAHIFDYGSGYAAALGIVTALYQRTITGRGQYIDVSMLETALAMNATAVSDVLNANARPWRKGSASDTPGSLAGILRCGGDTRLMLSASREPQRQRFWQLIGRPDIPKDERFATAAARAANSTALYAEIEKALAAKTAREWESLMADAAIGASEVKSVPDALAHPHVVARQPFHDFGLVPEIGIPVKAQLAPYRLSEGASRINRPPPIKGQHTAEILAELGYDAGVMQKLREQGVV